MRTGTAIATLVLAAGVTHSHAAGSSIDRYVELLRSDIKANKTALLTEALELSEAEGKAFWPIYREYDAELKKLGDLRYNLLKQYAKAYEIGSVQDSIAEDLAARWFKISEQRLDLLKKYYGRISRAVSPMRAAQFVQAENQIGLLIDLDIAAEIPFIEKSK